MRVSVCVNTFHRPQTLGQLLEDLAALQGEPTLSEVVITDNDAGGSGRATVEAAMDKVPFALIYQIEPEQNISLARNRGIHRATGDWIGLLDDDERVAPDWLAQKAAQAARSSADGVFGPVEQQIPDDAPAWMPRDGGSLHGYAPLASGTVMPANMLFSGNVLIRKAVLTGRDGPFDPGYGLSGGEDADLFNALRRNGAHFVWCAEAPAIERLGPERMQQTWFLTRSRRGAQDYALQVLDGVYGPVSASTRLRLGLDAAAKWLIAVLGYTALRLTGAAPPQTFAWRRKVAAQLGKFDVLLGRGRILEYQKKPAAK